jgi:hypothetical protein
MVLQDAVAQIKGRDGTMESIFVSRIGDEVMISIYAVNGSMNIVLPQKKIAELINNLEQA